jgi:Niemann-Pick C1 protein
MEDGRIPPELFERYLTWFRKDNPYEKCPKAGHAAHGEGLQLQIINETTQAAIPTATYFMTYHTILKTSKDYIEAMKEARALSQNITDTLNAGRV